MKAYLNGLEITPENFSENVETGDVITLVIQPKSGYILSNVLLNDTVLARNETTYTFTVQEGKIKKEVSNSARSIRDYGNKSFRNFRF